MQEHAEEIARADELFTALNGVRVEDVSGQMWQGSSERAASSPAAQPSRRHIHSLVFAACAP